MLNITQNIFHIINLLLLTRLSDHLNDRGFVALLQPLWTLPCLIALRWWPGVMVDKWGTYALVITLLSYPYARKNPVSSPLDHCPFANHRRHRCYNRWMDVKEF